MNVPARPLLPHLLPNVRDAGGLRTEDGHRLRHRKFLRSGALIRLIPATAHALTGYTGPATYLDLRTDGEVEKGGEPIALMAHGWQWQRVPLCDREPGDWGTAPEDQLRRYREHWPLYTDAARTVASSLRHGPVVVGCQLGKDRTGMVVALVLWWLGVERQDIIEDFELSNRCLIQGHRLLPPPWHDPRCRPGVAAGWVCAAVIDAIGTGTLQPGARSDLKILRRDLRCSPPDPTPDQTLGRRPEMR